MQEAEHIQHERHASDEQEVAGACHRRGRSAESVQA